MGSLVLLLSLFSNAWASRKSDTIRLLNLEKRFEEAQDKCTKWSAFNPESELELREFCAQAFWINAESKNTVEAWQLFQNDWVGTDWSKQALKREGKVALELLGENATEPEYLEIVYQYSGQEIEALAKSKAGTAAIRDVQNLDDAKRIAKEYSGHEEMRLLVEEYPGAFFSLSVKDGEIVLQAPENLNIEYDKPFWAYKSVDGPVQSWDDAIKKHLEYAGLEMVNIMRVIQQNQTLGPSFPLCPIPGSQSGDLPGVALKIAENVVFEPVQYDATCNLNQTAILVYHNKALLHASFKPGHHLDFRRKTEGHKDFTSFVSRPGAAILFEDRIFIPIGDSFAIYPLSGAAPWLTDQPPGALRMKMDDHLRGTGIPTNWSINGVSDGIQISYPNSSQWIVPSGELRFLSSLSLKVLGLDGIAFAQKKVPQIEWNVGSTGVSEMPSNASSITVRKLTEEDIKGLRYHIGGAGLEPFDLKVVDGFSVDLDNDRVNENVLRAQYKGEEVVLILDKDGTYGNRTWIYSTPHALHGQMAASMPFAFKVDDQVVFAWSGLEDKQPYVEFLYSQDGSFNIFE